MDIGKTLRVVTGRAWRTWLQSHHKTKKEIWLVYHRKDSGQPSIPYNDAVDEAMCFGWIDSIVKKLAASSRAQRFSPRRKGSPCSELNKARVRRLVAQGRMTQAGLEALSHEKDLIDPPKLILRPDVRKALRQEPEAWRNFQAFPDAYKRIRIGWIELARKRPEVFEARLKYFVKMTSRNKRFGMVQG